jgi:glycosyltransferase involved in cell wall biosynthesis
MKVTIFDDNSTDPHTVDILSKLQSELRVIRPQNGQLEKKTGGLYGNMNAALEMAHKSNFQYALFIQDDMQLVRSLRRVDFEMVENFFEFNTNAVQYQSCFRRRDTSERLERLAFLDASKTAFFFQMT